MDIKLIRISPVKRLPCIEKFPTQNVWQCKNAYAECYDVYDNQDIVVTNCPVLDKDPKGKEKPYNGWNPNKTHENYHKACTWIHILAKIFDILVQCVDEIGDNAQKNKQ